MLVIKIRRMKRRVHEEDDDARRGEGEEERGRSESPH